MSYFKIKFVNKKLGVIDPICYQQIEFCSICDEGDIQSVTSLAVLPLNVLYRITSER